MFKNNLEDIDDSNMVDGNVYGHLLDNITASFGNGNNLTMVDSPSIEVRRVDPVDTFTYNVLMDVHIIQNKDWMKNQFKASPSGYDQKFVLANAIVKDMECSVTFIPKYNKDNGSVTYDAAYAIKTDREYEVEYNQIVYNYNGKTKHRTISPQRRFTLDFSDLAGVNLTWERSNLSLSQMTNELISKRIDELFGHEDYANILAFVNNHIPEDREEVVDTYVVDNPGYEDNIWPLLEDPRPTDGEIASYDRGWTYIRGELYKIEDEDKTNPKVVPTTGSTEYDIVEVET